MQRVNLTIKDYHAQWREENNINLSRFVQSKIDEEMGGEVWEHSDLFHEPGVTIGRHIKTNSRVVYDRFRSPTGYNMLVLGDTGVGKTHGEGYHLSQREQFNNGIVYIDPMDSEEICDRVDGTNVHIGGEIRLNPLRVEPFDGVDPDIAGHLTAKNKMKLLEAFFGTVAVDGVSDFFEPSQGLESVLDHPVGRILSDAVEHAYDDVGIDLSDPSTLSKESPTIQDNLIPVLEDYRDTADEGTVPEVAEKLLSILEPFEEGNELSNLGGKSELDLDQYGSTYITIDKEMPVETITTLLLGEANEWAKQCDQKSIITVDDSRHLFRTKEGIEVVEQLLRHARHHNTSIQMHACTVDPFATPEGKAVLDQFDHKLIYRIERLEKQTADLLGLDEPHAKFVQNADPGNEDRGFAEAVFTTPSRGWYPLKIVANKV